MRTTKITENTKFYEIWYLQRDRSGSLKLMCIERSHPIYNLISLKNNGHLFNTHSAYEVAGTC